MTQNSFGTPPIFSNLHKKIVTVLRSETYQAIMIHLGIIIRFLQAVKGNPEKRGKEKPHLARTAPCVIFASYLPAGSSNSIWKLTAASCSLMLLLIS